MVCICLINHFKNNGKFFVCIYFKHVRREECMAFFSFQYYESFYKVPPDTIMTIKARSNDNMANGPAIVTTCGMITKIPKDMLKMLPKINFSVERQIFFLFFCARQNTVKLMKKKH